MSHFLAFASRVITSSRSTSSMLWSSAIFDIASRKRVSTLRIQGGRQGFHSWNLVDGLGFGFAIFRYYSDITVLCMVLSFSLLSMLNLVLSFCLLLSGHTLGQTLLHMNFF